MIYALDAAIPPDDEIRVDLGDRRGLPRGALGAHVRLTIPRIEGTVVQSFPDEVEQQVPLHCAAAARLIIPVNARSWAVEYGITRK